MLDGARRAVGDVHRSGCLRGPLRRRGASRHAGGNTITISLKALVRVARARAAYAEYATGRDSRPTNERLAGDTGLSVRTVQRADSGCSGWLLRCCVGRVQAQRSLRTQTLRR